ncbi:unknown [Bacteroides sp. CAG:633]|nr:unknown [Bacteroides sp. CAG:633]
MKNEELPALCRTVLHSFFMLWYVRLTCGCQKQKYLKLSSFQKEGSQIP